MAAEDATHRSNMALDFDGFTRRDSRRGFRRTTETMTRGTG